MEMQGSRAVRTAEPKRAAKNTGGAQKNAAAEYARILKRKMETLDEDLKRLERLRTEIREVDTLRRDAEARGTMRTRTALPETVMRLMGDGSILVTTTKAGRIVEQYRKKPRLVPVPDPAAPEDALPSQRVKWEPKLRLLDLLGL